MGAERTSSRVAPPAPAPAPNRGARPTRALVFAVLATSILEVFDYLTGPYVSFSLLFLVPVVLVAWRVGPAAGVFMAVFAVACESIADWSWPQVRPSVLAWNAFSRVGMLTLGAIAVARLRRDRDARRAANAELARLLDAEARARRESELRFGALAEAMTDHAILQFDAGWRARAWSSPAVAILGRSPSEIEGRTMDELFPAVEPLVSVAPLTTWADTSARAELDRWTLRPDGSTYWANVVMYTTPGETAHLVVVRDATERKRAEEELRRARDDAVALARELETLTHTVAHDLRAPLRAIDGFGGMLVEDHGERLDARALGYVTRMREAARRMGRLIDELLEMSRIGRSALRRARVDLTDIARTVERRLREAEPGRDVDVRIEGGLVADGDPELVGIAMRHLLENAWKFSATRARAHIVVGASSDGVFFVGDDGVGFDMQFIDRLFRPFERLHRVDEFEGTGIGLAIVRRIVERHGGRVWAESAVGRGATFWFSLPGDTAS